MKLLICCLTYLDGWNGRMQGSITCFLLSNDLPTPTSHWPKVAMQCSSTRHNYGYWRPHEMTQSHGYTNWRILVIHIPGHYLQWERTETCESLTHERANRSTQTHAVKAYVNLPTSMLNRKLPRRQTMHGYWCQPVVLGTGHWRGRTYKGHLSIKTIEESRGQCLQNYACRFGKANTGSQIYSSWGKSWCSYWLLSSLWSATTQEEFPRSCSSCWFGCKKVPQLQGEVLRKKWQSP